MPGSQTYTYFVHLAGLLTGHVRRSWYKRCSLRSGNTVIAGRILEITSPSSVRGLSRLYINMPGNNTRSAEHRSRSNSSSSQLASCQLDFVKNTVNNKKLSHAPFCVTDCCFGQAMIKRWGIFYSHAIEGAVKLSGPINHVSDYNMHSGGKLRQF